MRFGQGLAFVFAESWAFVRQVWWLALLMPLALVARDIAASPLVPLHGVALSRATLALACLAVAIMPYWFIRFIALRHDIAAAVSMNRAAARTYAPFFVAMALLQFAGALTGSGTWFSTTISWAVLAAVPLIAAWSVTAPSGSAVIGPARSARLVLPHYFWGLALTVVGPLLLLIPLFAANAAMGVMILRGASVDPWLSLIAFSATRALFSMFNELLQFAALFVIAHRAGVRVSEDRQLATVFE